MAACHSQKPCVFFFNVSGGIEGDRSTVQRSRAVCGVGLVFSTQAEASPKLLIIVLVGAYCRGDGKEDLSL